MFKSVVVTWVAAGVLVTAQAKENGSESFLDTERREQVERLEIVDLYPEEKNSSEDNAKETTDQVDPVLLGLRSTAPLDRGYRYSNYNTSLFLAPNLVHWFIPSVIYNSIQREVIGDSGTLYLHTQWGEIQTEYPLHHSHAYSLGNTGQYRAGVCTLPSSSQTHGTNGGLMECGRIESANFSGQTLNWSLNGLIARNSNFSGATFSGSRLWDFNATGSNFDGAVMTQTQITNGSLSLGTARNLRVSNSYIDLNAGYSSDYWYRYTHQNFASHTLYSGRGIDLSGSRFEQSYLNLDCSGCDLRSTVLDRSVSLVQLNSPIQKRSELRAIASDVTGLQIVGGTLQEFTLTCSIANGVIITPHADNPTAVSIGAVRLKSTQANSVNFNGAQISTLTIMEDRHTCNGSRIRSSTLSAQLRNMTVTSGYFQGSNPGDLVNLDGASFSNSVFQNSSFQHVRAQAASFRGTALRSANFNNVDLRSADLRNADLTNARLKDVDLSGANLAGADLFGARYNSFTAQRFPVGFSPQSRGMILDDTL